MKNTEIGNAKNEFHNYVMFKYQSANTAKNYSSAVASFLSAFPNASRPRDISADEIIQYLLRFENLSTRRNAHSAIKLFYKYKSKNGFSNKFRYIPYPEKEEKLPNPITKQEFVLIINACQNIKHKCILMLGFDCGLRVSEVINLRVADIDIFKMQVRILGAKGHKDRVVKLSIVLLNFLQQYFLEHKPTGYLFTGQNNAPQYSVRSCQEILKTYAAKAGITRNVTFHQNRHGFAMSLLENGTDFNKIQHALGHNSPKTTQIYARINNRVIQSVQSPLEQIMAQDQKALLPPQ